MVGHNGLMRIFWPSDAPRGTTPGVLVGFRHSDTDVFVVGILQEVEVRLCGEMSDIVLTDSATARRKRSNRWHTVTKQFS
jgi:hypothetical protein